MTERIALAARIDASLSELAQRVKEIREKALTSGDDAYWDAVALNLHGFYGGLERIFEDIARTMDQGLPSGPDWHKALLMQLSVELPNKRPAVVTRELYRRLDEYRAFRHVVRNVYAFSFHLDRVDALGEALPACFAAVEGELTAFREFLTYTDIPDR